MLERFSPEVHNNPKKNISDVLSLAGIDKKKYPMINNNDWKYNGQNIIQGPGVINLVILTNGNRDCFSYNGNLSLFAENFKYYIVDYKILSKGDITIVYECDKVLISKKLKPMQSTNEQVDGIINTKSA